MQANHSPNTLASFQHSCTHTAETPNEACTLREAAGTDGVSGKVLKAVALPTIRGLHQDLQPFPKPSHNPTMHKVCHNLPCLHETAIHCLNDYRPIALTSLVMKCFERLILQHIKASYCCPLAGSTGPSECTPPDSQTAAFPGP